MMKCFLVNESSLCKRLRLTKFHFQHSYEVKRSSSFEKPEYPLMYLETNDDLEDDFISLCRPMCDSPDFLRYESQTSSCDGFTSALNYLPNYPPRSNSHEGVNHQPEFYTEEHGPLLQSKSLEDSTRKEKSSRSKSVERPGLVAMRQLTSQGSYEERLSPHSFDRSSYDTRGSYDRTPGGAASSSGTHLFLILPNKQGLVAIDDHKSRMNQRRLCRHDKRYHTADAIHEIRKDITDSGIDAAIKKRLSWNYGTVDINIEDKHSLKSKTFSSESLRSMPSSSGVSSTESYLNKDEPPQLTSSHSDYDILALHSPDPHSTGPPPPAPFLITHPAPSLELNETPVQTSDLPLPGATLTVATKLVSKSMPDIASGNHVLTPRNDIFTPQRIEDTLSDSTSDTLTSSDKEHRISRQRKIQMLMDSELEVS